jgi:hypothetical protein
MLLSVTVICHQTIYITRGAEGYLGWTTQSRGKHVIAYVNEQYRVQETFRYFVELTRRNLLWLHRLAGYVVPWDPAILLSESWP